MLAFGPTRSMKRKIQTSSLAVLLIAGHAIAADSTKEARVTQIIHDVKLLPSDAAPRPAVVNDKVREDTGVRTGGDSRSELTFADLTITRLGSNSIFSFTKAGRNDQLESGSILLRVPKDSGGGRVKTNAVTVAVTGTTFILESGLRNKLFVLEGSARLSLVKYPSQSQNVRAGQMVDVPPGAKTVPLPTNFDLNELMRKHPLITDFPPLPSRDLIVAASQQQPPPAPPNSGSGPSAFPILPVIDLFGGGVNRGPHHHPPRDNRPQQSPTPRPVTGEGSGAGSNKVPPNPQPVNTRKAPSKTQVPPVTTRTQNIPHPSPTPKKRAVKKTNQSNHPGGPQ